MAMAMMKSSSFPQAAWNTRQQVINTVTCKWEALREQMLMQWDKLEAKELDIAGGDRRKLARLVHREYGVAVELVENYLRNFERTLPLM